jgi:monoterpene epsilon-lactone hydrolase
MEALAPRPQARQLLSGDADMPSQAMQDVIDTLRGQQKAAASQPSRSLEQRRAAFAPAGRLHPLPDDVVVRDVTAGGVPAHWLAAPGPTPAGCSCSCTMGVMSSGRCAATASWPPGWDGPGFPPLLIQTGTADILLSDSQPLAAAATRAGVHVTLHIGDGLPHVYPIMAGTPEAAQATEQTGDFLRTRAR